MNILNRFVLVLVFALLIGSVGTATEPIAVRGYYYTFGRMPTFGLAAWKQIIDGNASDGANTILLWVGGAFRSKRFPITWQYNRDHKNIQSDFVRELIDYAHSKGIKVLLGFTPFSYDGVNQYAFEHPELKAVQKNGNLAKLSGIHCWGYALNPSRREAQEFMHDYVHEMFFDFYPNADGLMIESSDYAICFCTECQGHYYEREYQFVRRISDDIWKVKPDATIMVYPHYFSGQNVPGFDIKAAKLPYDPRWTLFFTPHSAHIDPAMLKLTNKTVYWDASTDLNTPVEIQAAVQTARKFQIPGYVPTLEGFSFEVKQPEGGERFLIGKRLKPFGFDWLADGQYPYNELPIRVNRIAYREFTQHPDLSYSDFKTRLGSEIFGAAADPARTDDLLFMQQSFFAGRSWFSASPLVSPALLNAKLEMGALSLQQIGDYKKRLQRIRQIAARYSGAIDPASAALGKVAAWISQNWDGDRETVLADHLR